MQDGETEIIERDPMPSDGPMGEIMSRMGQKVTDRRTTEKPIRLSRGTIPLRTYHKVEGA